MYLNLFLLCSTILNCFDRNVAQMDVNENSLNLNEPPPAADAVVPHPAEHQGEAGPRPLLLDLNQIPPIEEEIQQQNNDAASSSNNQTSADGLSNNPSDANEMATNTKETDSPRKNDESETDEFILDKHIPRKQRTAGIRRPVVNIDRLNKEFSDLQTDLNLTRKIPKKFRSKRPSKKRAAKLDKTHGQMVVGEASDSKNGGTLEQKDFIDEAKQRKRRGVEKEMEKMAQNDKDRRPYEKQKNKEMTTNWSNYKPQLVASQNVRSPSSSQLKHYYQRKKTIEDRPGQIAGEKAQKFADCPSSSPLAAMTQKRRKMILKDLDDDDDQSISINNEMKNSVNKNCSTDIKEKEEFNQENVTNEETFYHVSKILAMYTYRADNEEKRLFFVDWKGYTDEESWEPSESMYSQELVADFLENCALISVVHALSGKKVPEHFAKEMKKNTNLEMMHELGKNPKQMKTIKIAFAEDITPRQKNKANKEIGNFLKEQLKLKSMEK